jgi:hypothetical protein
MKITFRSAFVNPTGKLQSNLGSRFSLLSAQQWHLQVSHFAFANAWFVPFAKMK